MIAKTYFLNCNPISIISNSSTCSTVFFNPGSANYIYWVPLKCYKLWAYMFYQLVINVLDAPRLEKGWKTLLLHINPTLLWQVLDQEIGHFLMTYASRQCLYFTPLTLSVFTTSYTITPNSPLSFKVWIFVFKLCSLVAKSLSDKGFKLILNNVKMLAIYLFRFFRQLYSQT